MLQKVIAIDGPSASGKGTVALQVASALGRRYLDSGALYRIIALHARRRHTRWDDEPELARLAHELPVEFADSGVILLSGEDVSAAIRSEEIGMGASQVAALPAVRAALLQRQRAFLTAQGLVADGRDMGSVVFPDAELKIFLTASPRVRAERRAKQIGMPTQSAEFERILADIEARDEADRSRVVAPLRKLPEAYLLDTSDLSIDEAVEQILVWYQSIYAQGK